MQLNSKMDSADAQFKEDEIRANENYPVSLFIKEMQNKVMLYLLFPNRRMIIASFGECMKTIPLSVI